MAIAARGCDSHVVQAAFAQSLGGRAVPTTAIIVETLRDDWLVEIEIIAAG